MNRFRLVLLVGVAFAAPAQAQIICANCTTELMEIPREVARIAQVAKQIAQLQAQYQQLVMTYEAFTHVTDLGSAVGALGMAGIRNPLPINPYAVQGLMNGTGGVGGMSGNIGSLFSGTLAGNQVYAAKNDTWIGQELNRNGGGIAGAQSLAMELYRAAADRMGHLDGLRDQIATAADPSVRETLIAQLGAEQTAISNQQVQASTLGNYMQAQLASQQQRVQERRQMEIDQVLADARAHGVSIGGGATTVAGGGQ